MNFSVNGHPQGIPVAPDSTFDELLKYIQRSFNSERAVVSCVRVNGTELSAQDQDSLGPVAVRTLESVEVSTIHPRELAEETLQSLIPFTEHLSGLSTLASSPLGPREREETFRKLVDGLETFSQAVDSAKKILHVGGENPELPGVAQLEREMIAVLREIARSREARDGALLRNLLELGLPANLSRWHDEGIPSLIRCRDS